MEMVHGALFLLLIFSALMTPGSSQESCGPGRVYNTVLRRCVTNAGEFSHVTKIMENQKYILLCYVNLATLKLGFSLDAKNISTF
jgi:hypothetical protein